MLTVKKEGDLTFGRRLRLVIDLAGITVRQLERDTKIPYRTLHDYLSDRSKPGLDHLIKLDDAGFRVEWLVRGKIRPGIHLDLPEGNHFGPVTGIVAASPDIRKTIAHEAISLIDELVVENPDYAVKMGLWGLLYSVWSVVYQYSEIVNGIEDKVTKALEKGVSLDDTLSMVLKYARNPLKEKLRLIDPVDAVPGQEPTPAGAQRRTVKP